MTAIPEAELGLAQQVPAAVHPPIRVERLSTRAAVRAEPAPAPSGPGRSVRGGSALELEPGGTLSLPPEPWRDIELSIDLPARVQAGSALPITVVVTNRGQRSVANLTLDWAWPGTVASLDGQPGSGSQPLPVLAPLARLEVPFVVTSAQPAVATGSVTLRFHQQELSWQQPRLEFVTPSLQVRLAGPTQRTLGETAEFTLSLTNSSSRELRLPRVRWQPSPAVDVTAVSKGAFAVPAVAASVAPAAAGEIPTTSAWEWGSLALAPRETIVLQIDSQTQQVAQPAVQRIEIQIEDPNHGIVTETQASSFAIAAPSCGIRCEITDECDPVRVGADGEYTLTVQGLDVTALPGEHLVRIELPLTCELKAIVRESAVGAQPAEFQLRGPAILLPLTTANALGPRLWRCTIVTRAVRKGSGAVQVEYLGSGANRPVRSEEWTQIIAP